MTLIKIHIALISFLLGAAITQCLKDLDGNAVFLVVIAGLFMLSLAILSIPIPADPPIQDTPEAKAARLAKLREEMKLDPQKTARIRCLDGRKLG